MSELKPCPFCGKPPEHPFSGDGFPTMCECIWEAKTSNDAIARWNTRPIEDKQAELIRLLGDTLDDLRENKTSLMLIWGDRRMKAIYAYAKWKEEQK